MARWWPAIERVAEALLVRRELDQTNIDELISTASGEVSTRSVSGRAKDWFEHRSNNK